MEFESWEEYRFNQHQIRKVATKEEIEKLKQEVEEILEIEESKL